jgi:hypothetical protein
MIHSSSESRLAIIGEGIAGCDACGLLTKIRPHKRRVAGEPTQSNNGGEAASSTWSRGNN